jgi:FlaA1/EpsC-like NDP-sugar epimerase
MPPPDQKATARGLGRIGPVLERYRLAFQMAVDLLAWALALYVAMVLRFDSFAPDGWNHFRLQRLLLAMAVAAAFQIVAGLALGLYLGRFRFGTIDEVSHLAGTIAVTTLGLAVVNQLCQPLLVPTSVTLAAGVLALIFTSAPRYAWRLVLERRMRPSGADVERVLIFGAGEGGAQTITAMLRNPNSPYLPVALLDDDPAKRNLRVRGVRVVGGRQALASAAAEYGATTVVMAMPGASSELLRELGDQATEAHLGIRVLPPLTELFGAPIGVGDIRPLTDVDLLGRHVVDTDVNAIAGYLTGRRVLVTGAGGSIGSELSHQLSQFAPASLVLVDRDESALHALQLRLEGRALLDDRSLVVADVRDGPRMIEVFEEHRPQVVFHAAALKHLPLLEMHPREALKTNVIGTQHVLVAAQHVGVERFVNISTDKAADPISALGYTKRICERLTAAANDDRSGTYLSVRFGNVLGSRGSVLTAFHAQIEAGGPLTVTDPEVTRYFMTVAEAVQLVIQAGAVGQAGEALVLDMGEPVRIDEVARRLADQAPRPVDIVYVGLRPGEKLHEVLLGSGEPDRRPSHPQISQVPVPPLAYPLVDVLCAPGLDDAALRRGLHELAALGVAPPDPASSAPAPAATAGASTVASGEPPGHADLGS